MEETKEAQDKEENRGHHQTDNSEQERTEVQPLRQIFDIFLATSEIEHETYVIKKLPQ